MNKNLKKSPPEYSESTQSPVSFSSIGLSPIPSRNSVLSTKTLYKSPNTTPVSPKLLERNSIEESFPSPQETRDMRRESVSKLTQRLWLKEKQIHLLEEENKRLAKIKNVEQWEKELISRNQDVRKLEFQVNYYKSILRDKIDSAKLIETIENQSKKIVELEILVEELQEARCRKHEDELKDLKSDNITLINALNQYSSGPTKEDWEMLLKKLKDSEKSYEFVCGEKNRLMDEIQRMKRELPVGSLIYFSQDVAKIKKEVGKLFRIATDVHKGKEISLQGLLGIDTEYNTDPAQQMCKDVQCIKQDLNNISNIISDVLAGHCAEIICKSQ